MTKRIYNKLVRDRIPEIIKSTGGESATKILNDKEYLRELILKLKEEAAELDAEPSIEELADIKEVVITIREALCIHAGELEEVRCKKAAERGRFKKRIFLKNVEE